MTAYSMPRTAPHVANAPGSGIRGLIAQAASMANCIHLEVGQPDFRTPEHICEAAARAIRSGDHGYTPTRGMASLLDEVTAKLARVNGIAAEAGQITMACGGTSALAAALFAVCEPGDEILVSDPYWPTLPTIVAVAGARCVLYSCPSSAGYQPDLDHLAAQISPRTKAIVVNSPNNPTGAVYPASTLAAIGEIAARRGIWVISDECYDQVVLDSPGLAAPSAWGNVDPGRVITAMAMSKTYAMTGWRIGYGIAPAPVMTQMIKVIDATTSCSNVISQRAAEEALRGPQDAVLEMADAYRARRDASMPILDRSGVPHSLPHGAMYLLADIRATGLSSAEFCRQLLDRHGVAVVAGSAFGPGAEGLVRISLASSIEALTEGLSRLCMLIDTCSTARLRGSLA